MSEIEKIDLKIYMLEAWQEAMKIMLETNDPRKAGDAFELKVRSL